ncbi:hypothetical protein FJT64_002018 [Amphibalanus amphitrite]|uniref:Uncharacterized protein n=1 Tax=Amphibalanus amphitrite TaxID=1232801 RepID=A0A6A4X2L9_AMPAM|nr:hypothetical protein FJT64_002018 [Amphibalanus amphitrite]
MDAASVDATAGLWRRRVQQLLSGDRLRTAYDAVTGWWPDRWEMMPYYEAVDETDSEGKTVVAPTAFIKSSNAPSVSTD